MSVFDGSAPMADHAVLCRLAHGMMTGIWTPYIPLVWVTNLQVYRESVALSYGIGAFGHGNYGGGGTETIGFPTPAIDVGSFLADSEEYTERASIALVQANEKSYYFDQTNQLLYVQFGNGTKPSLHAAKLVGMLLYYSNKEIDVDNRHYALISGYRSFRRDQYLLSTSTVSLIPSKSVSSCMGQSSSFSSVS